MDQLSSYTKTHPFHDNVLRKITLSDDAPLIAPSAGDMRLTSVGTVFALLIGSSYADTYVRTTARVVMSRCELTDDGLALPYSGQGFSTRKSVRYHRRPRVEHLSSRQGAQWLLHQRQRQRPAKRARSHFSAVLHMSPGRLQVPSFVLLTSA